MTYGESLWGSVNRPSGDITAFWNKEVWSEFLSLAIIGIKKKSMHTQLNNQEIFLLTRYCSPPYFLQLRNAWGCMVNHVEQCLSQYLRSLPADYRSKPLPEQPDVVWGELVLPNFRETYVDLCNGYIEVLNGDVSGLSNARSPMNDYKGQLEYWSGWMGAEDEAIYKRLLEHAIALARNITVTERGNWMPERLGDKYNELVRGPLDLPPRLPNYRLNTSVRIASGDPVRAPGIFVPDRPNSSAQFLSPFHNEAPDAIVKVGVEPVLNKHGEIADDVEVYENQPCIWTLVDAFVDDEKKRSDGKISMLRD